MAASLLLVGGTLLSVMPARAMEVFAGLGTTGLEVGIGDRIGGAMGLRMSAEFLDLARDFERNGATYDTRLKFSSLGVYGDFFLAGGFRVTAGALLGTRKASGDAVATNGTITINGTSYPAAGENVAAEAKFPSAAPYVGIGWGHHQPASGMNFYADLGVVIGKADAKLTPSAGILAAAGAGNIAAEQANLQESVDKLKAYPALKLGFSYKF
ncbi:MAG: hypothetical protein AB7U92_23015 [Piscinibacter sp.]|uniref:hypothetical protein n=1 Tax=Piscinibacter sp. TaxID=1903157 RepID=UPI003D0BBDFD